MLDRHLRLGALVAAVIGALSGPSSLATEVLAPIPLRIVAIEVTTESGSKGVNIYAPVMDVLARRIGQAIPYDTVPPGRALPLMDNAHYDCVFPADTGNRSVPYPALQSHPLNRAYVYAFSVPGRPVVRTIAGLKDLRIGARQGYYFGKGFDPVRQNFVPARSDDSAMTLLLAGDTDVMIGYMPDMLEVFRRFPANKLDWDPKAPLSGQAEAIMCRDKAETRAFLQRINPALALMEQSGELKSLLGDRWIAPVR